MREFLRQHAIRNAVEAYAHVEAGVLAGIALAVAYGTFRLGARTLDRAFTRVIDDW